MKRNRKWWDIRAQANAAGEVEIRIYNEIGFWGTDAQTFVTQLDAAAANPSAIVVAINSMGGDVFDAFAIYNALRRHAGKVKVRVDGVAASAASLIAMAGDEIVMPENAMLMIHNAHTVTAGEAKDLRRIADLLDNAGDGILAAYAAKSGQSVDEIRALMDAETWLTAAQAKEKGFCDTIEAAVKMSASVSSTALLARFSAVPDVVRALVDEDEPSDPPQPDTPPNTPPDPKPDPVPEAKPDPQPVPPTPDVSALASHVFAACRDARLSHCAEAIVTATGLKDRATVDAAIQQAADIAGICLAANVPELTAQFVADGLTPDHVRARLFERVTASQSHINPRAQPTAQTEPTAVANAPRAASIYAARKSGK
ncbi:MULTISPECIES: head maturation protease, ClpP-related [unclassified Burkholderia]|uniref:head maturation protease, ClpP-related n=1 Tax=unclassified Burkholderia TaxID=2613784 RepID=UPI000F5701AA|nr:MULTISPECIES: head maturation protease, ClpP-related [unclassified Burkholderia]RQR45580.1 Clp protease ClpP [Burkholderia sp. Bp9131]RQR77667.1 Clp protease ClpP [Burkholderia sp. Bp9015]